MRIVVIVLLALSSVCGCRKPPAPTDPAPADASPVPRDGGPGDPGPARDGSVSDCVGREPLTCALLAAEAAEEGWQDRMDTALDPVRDEVRVALLASGGVLCGQTGSGVVHYVGDDSAVQGVFEALMDGWLHGEVVTDPGGRECTTVQPFEREGLTIELGTRRAQRSFSLRPVVAP